jgi:group I intron endonuclease
METVLKISRSAIYSALLKHGIAKFKLEILVYCSQKKCIKLEQEHINLLNPSYNILKIAGSPLGEIRSEKTRAKMSVANKGKNNPMFGKTLSAVTRAKISASLKGIPRPERPEVTRAKISASQPHSRKIEVLDIETNVTTTYPTIRAAARALNINQSSITKYFSRKQKKPYKGRYVFKLV